MTLGTAIRTLRRQRGLNLNQLGKLTEQDPSYLSKIERGQVKNVSSKLMGKIAQALGVSTDYLYVEAGWLERRERLPDPASGESVLIAALRSIPTPGVREKLLEQFTWIAEVARDADLARRPALRLVAEEETEYEEGK